MSLPLLAGSSVQSSAVNQTLTTVSKSRWSGTWHTRLGAATVPEWFVVNKLNRVLTKPGRQWIVYYHELFVMVSTSAMITTSILLSPVN